VSLAVPTVTLDANVLFPASLRDLLLRAMEHGLYRVAISRQGWDEVTRNLARTGRVTPEGLQALAQHIPRTVTRFQDQV